MKTKKFNRFCITRKWALIICALALAIGAFEVYVVNHYLRTKKLASEMQRMYQIEENDAKKCNSGIQAETRSVNGTELTIYYPIDQHGQRIMNVQAEIDRLIAEQQASDQFTNTPFTFFKTARKASDFSNLDEIMIYQSSYQIRNSGVEQTLFARRKRLYITQENELITNTTLFKTPDAAKQVLLEQIRLALDSKDALPQQKESLYDKMNQIPLEQWDLDYQTGQLIVTFPENEMNLTSVSVLMSHLYTSMNSEYLSPTDLDTYEKYVAKQNVVSISTNDATPIVTPPSSGKKLIALTFDDGPDGVSTARILDTLAQYQAKATFFILGSKVEGQEALIQRMVAEGHELGNHTWGHPELTKLSAEGVVREYTSTQEAITKASNGVVPRVLRPPYGVYNSSVNDLIDIPLVLWSIDTLDWKHRDTASILSEVQQQTFDGGIILMHDIHPSSAAALPAVLHYLYEQGYSFVTVSELHAQYGLSEEVYIP